MSWSINKRINCNTQLRLSDKCFIKKESWPWVVRFLCSHCFRHSRWGSASACHECSNQLLFPKARSWIPHSHWWSSKYSDEAFPHLCILLFQWCLCPDCRSFWMARKYGIWEFGTKWEYRQLEGSCCKWENVHRYDQSEFFLPGKLFEHTWDLACTCQAAQRAFSQVRPG